MDCNKGNKEILINFREIKNAIIGFKMTFEFNKMIRFKYNLNFWIKFFFCKFIDFFEFEFEEILNKIYLDFSIIEIIEEKKSQLLVIHFIIEKEFFIEYENPDYILEKINNKLYFFSLDFDINNKIIDISLNSFEYIYCNNLKVFLIKLNPDDQILYYMKKSIVKFKLEFLSEILKIIALKSGGTKKKYKKRKVFIDCIDDENIYS